MAKRFTYRELTLLLGIVVALIVMFTFWHPQWAPQSPTAEVSSIQHVYDMIDEQKELFREAINGFSVLSSNRNSLY